MEINETNSESNNGILREAGNGSSTTKTTPTTPHAVSKSSNSSSGAATLKGATTSSPSSSSSSPTSHLLTKFTPTAPAAPPSVPPGQGTLASKDNVAKSIVPSILNQDTDDKDSVAGNDSGDSTEQMMVEVDQFPRVPVSDWLYTADDVRRMCERIRWTKAGRPNRGLIICSVGNTCFLNAVLQCLIYTVSLAEVALNHNDDGTEGMYNVVMRLIQNRIQSPNGAVKPENVLEALKKFWSSYRLGRQEDAEECFTKIVEGMHQSNLIQGGMSSDDIGPLTETTMMHRVFGGHLRSQLKCTKCGYESNTFESFMDLSVEISKRTKHIETALSEFTSIETLGGENKCFCEKCHNKVKAKKQMTIRSPPINLVVSIQAKERHANGAL